MLMLQVIFCHQPSLFLGVCTTCFISFLSYALFLLFQNLLHLAEIMLVIPISSAQCERGFSSQKRIKSDARSSLSVSTTEDLIRISMEGPELQSFQPTAAVSKWMNCGQAARRPCFAYRQWPEDLVSVSHSVEDDLD